MLAGYRPQSEPSEVDAHRYKIFEAKFFEGDDINFPTSRLKTTVDNQAELELADDWLVKPFIDGQPANDAIRRYARLQDAFLTSLQEWGILRVHPRQLRLSGSEVASLAASRRLYGVTVVQQGHPARQRLRVYVDGFNLYYGSLKDSPYKWLDLEQLTRQLAPTMHLDHVRYFTARVSGKLDPGSPNRQNAYLRALRSLPSLTVHFGQFRTRPVSMPLATPPVTGPRFATVMKTEEKGSDVNLATYLLLDGVDGLWDVAIVISNDSDLATPIHLAVTRFGEVRVYNPHRSINAVLGRVASRYRPLSTLIIAASQFPPTVQLPAGGTVRKPASW